MNKSSNNKLFGKYVIELRLMFFLITFLCRFVFTHFSKNFNLHLHVSLPVDTLTTVLPLKLFHFQTPIQSMSPQFCYSRCYIMMFIHLPLTHSISTVSSQIFSNLFAKKDLQSFNRIPSKTHVFSVSVGARVLILSSHCTCPELKPHLKPHCSYRKG